MNTQMTNMLTKNLRWEFLPVSASVPKIGFTPWANRANPPEKSGDSERTRRMRNERFAILSVLRLHPANPRENPTSRAASRYTIHPHRLSFPIALSLCKSIPLSRLRGSTLQRLFAWRSFVDVRFLGASGSLAYYMCICVSVHMYAFMCTRAHIARTCNQTRSHMYIYIYAYVYILYIYIYIYISHTYVLYT